MRHTRLVSHSRKWLPILAFALATARAGHAQASAPKEAAAFDRGDRESRELLSVVRCARRAAAARMEGAFGPIDSLGRSHQCLRINDRWFATFADIDTPFVTARRVVAVDLTSRSRVTAPFDTAALLALDHAEMSAQHRGAQEYRSARRLYVPLSMRFDGDTIEVWLIPASLLMGKERTVGGERGYVFTPDGTQLIRKMDSFTSYRPIVVPDSGQVRIVSSEASVPTMSEFVLANALHDSGRTVAIVTRTMTSTLIPSANGEVWLHLANGQPSK